MLVLCFLKTQCSKPNRVHIFSGLFSKGDYFLDFCGNNKQTWMGLITSKTVLNFVSTS